MENCTINPDDWREICLMSKVKKLWIFFCLRMWKYKRTKTHYIRPLTRSAFSVNRKNNNTSIVVLEREREREREREWEIPGFNFINILRTAFTLVGPKSVKRYWQLDWVLTLWGATGVKAVRRMLMKSSQWEGEREMKKDDLKNANNSISRRRHSFISY